MNERPPYEWNPLWTDVIDDLNPAYVGSVRRMVMASINWLADHPQASPEYREASRAELARRAGVPAGEDFQVIAAWEDVYYASNSYARHWFRAMSDACGKGESSPTSFMMSKSIACGMLFQRDGWEAFNQFMLERPGSTPAS